MRRVLCLVLVLCLLVPLLPVPSSAVATGGAAAAAGSWLLTDSAAKIASIVIGLGLTVEVVDGVRNSTAFDSLVETCRVWAQQKGYIDSSGKLQVFQKDKQLYIPQSLVEDVAIPVSGELTYDRTPIVLSFYSALAKSSVSFSATSPITYHRLCCVVSSYDKNMEVFVSKYPFTYSLSDGVSKNSNSGGSFYYACFWKYLYSSDEERYSPHVGYQTHDPSAILAAGIKPLEPARVPSSGLGVSSNVMSLTDSLADTFPAWASGAITVPKPGTTGETEDEVIPVWPIGEWNYKPGSTSKPITQEVSWGIEFEEEPTAPSEPTDPTSPIVVPPEIPGLDSEMNFFQRVLNSLETIAQHITDFVTAKWQEFMNWLHSMWDNLLQYCADMKQALDWIYEKIQEFGFRISETLELIPVKITEFLTEFKTWVQAAKDHLSGIRVGVQDIGGGIINLPGNIASAFEGFFEKSDVDLEDEEALEELKFDLTEFFPFCIPYDIYDMFAVLNADPVAPAFDIAIPVYGDLVTYHVDLSFLDGLASLIRTFEVLGFAIALGLLTRDKFLRG